MLTSVVFKLESKTDKDKESPMLGKHEYKADPEALPNLGPWASLQPSPQHPPPINCYAVAKELQGQENG